LKLHLDRSLQFGMGTQQLLKFLLSRSVFMDATVQPLNLQLPVAVHLLLKLCRKGGVLALGSA